MFTSWGWFSDARYRDNDEALQDMRAAGIKTVALQIAGGQPLYNPDVPGRCRAFGMKVALWGRAAPGDAECLALAKADGYMPQIEGPGEYDDAIAQLAAGTGAGLSLSTITTLGAMIDFIWLPPSTTWPQGRISTVQCERLKAAWPDARLDRVLHPGRRRPLPDLDDDVVRRPTRVPVVQPCDRPVPRNIRGGVSSVRVTLSSVCLPSVV